MKHILLAAFLCMLSAACMAATQATVTPGTWDLYSGTSRVRSDRTEAECIAAAKARGAGKYGCRTITTVQVVVTPDPPIPPDPVPEPPKPVPTGKPTPANTGPRTTDLKPLASTKISKAGVYENFTATSVVTISASNVTVRNFKITTSSDNCIRVNEGVSNVLLEDGECDGANSSGITGEGFTARRLYVHNMGSDAFHLNDAGNVTIEASYVTDLGYNKSSHADGVQVASGKNITIRGNNFHMPGEDPKYNNSQIFMIKPDFGPIENLRIEGNWLNGGGYSVNMAGASSNVSIKDNRFGKEYNFGPFNGVDHALVCGNTWEADGKPLGSPNKACQ